MPLRNDGLEPFTLRTIQISFREASGRSLVAEGCGEWMFEASNAALWRCAPGPIWLAIGASSGSPPGQRSDFCLVAEGCFIVAPRRSNWWG